MEMTSYLKTLEEVEGHKQGITMAGGSILNLGCSWKVFLKASTLWKYTANLDLEKVFAMQRTFIQNIKNPATSEW